MVLPQGPGPRPGSPAAPPWLPEGGGSLATKEVLGFIGFQDFRDFSRIYEFLGSVTGFPRTLIWILIWILILI